MAERADAARNRQAVLSAAARLFDEADDPGTVSMDDVARAAGVGKGTLFRRFGDRTSLLQAVYEAHLADLRDAIESGSPPLGPDAAPAERILAMLDAIVGFKLDHRQLVLAVEQGKPGGGQTLFDSPHYVEIHDILVQLLSKAIGPGDAAWTAHALLGATRIDMVDHIVTNDGGSREQMRANLRNFVERVLR
ncbi:MAG: TetR/AcrR family transcriptional regulator [Mycobacterium sp.]